MENLLTLIIVPFLIGVFVLVIEYFVIKPWRERKKSSQAISSYQPQGVQSQPSRSSSPEWTTARDRAIEQFKAQKTECNWLTSETISVEEFEIDEGRGALTIEILTTNISRGRIKPGYGVSGPYLLAKYQLTIDRTGDILEVKSIPKYLWF